MSFEDEEPDYVHAIVVLGGIPKPIHCWAAFTILKSGGVYLGNVQIESPGLALGPKDLETGIRPRLRRDFTEEDEQTLRAVLERELKGLLQP